MIKKRLENKSRQKKEKEFALNRKKRKEFGNKKPDRKRNQKKQFANNLVVTKKEKTIMGSSNARKFRLGSNDFLFLGFIENKLIF